LFKCTKQCICNRKMFNFRFTCH